MYVIEEGVIGGYLEQPVAFRHIKHEAKSDHLAIVLPGLGYTVDKPVLYYMTSALLEEGYDVFQVNYKYDDKDSFHDLNQEEREEWVQTDVERSIHHALEDGRYKHFCLVGKSLGTRAMVSEMTDRKAFQKAKTIWLTPLLDDSDVRETLRQLQQPSLLIIGSRDSHYSDNALEELYKKENVACVKLEGANHACEVPSNSMLSIQYLHRIIDQTKQFLKS
ncbi:alpha/beta family hydrolase [Pontibacillus salicampi]